MSFFAGHRSAVARAMIVLGTAYAVATFALFVSPAVASGPRIALSPSRVHRGRYVQVYGTLTGCPSGDAVTLISHAFPRRHSFAGVPAVSATVAKGGRYSVRVRVPSGKRPGAYSVSGRCGGGNLGVSVKLHVLR
jgi:hypothetical protein